MAFHNININFDPDQIEEALKLIEYLNQLKDKWWIFSPTNSGTWQYGLKSSENHSFRSNFSMSGQIDFIKMNHTLSLIDTIFLGLHKINNNQRLKNNSSSKVAIYKDKNHVFFYSNQHNVLNYLIPLEKFSQEKKRILLDLPENILLGGSNHERLKLRDLSGHIDPTKRDFYAKTMGKFKLLYYITSDQYNRKFYNIYKSISI